MSEVAKLRNPALMQQLLAGIFMSVAAAVAILDSNGRLVTYNTAFLRLLKFTGRQIEGRKLDDLLATAQARAKLHEARAVERAGPQEVQALIRRGDDSTALMKLTLTGFEQPELDRFRVLTVSEAPEPSENPDKIGGQDVRDVLVAGKIQLVGLDAVKAALGSRWEAYAGRAMMAAESILRRRLGPEDLYSRTQDNGFVICFADANEEEASFRAAIIAREIRNRLIGEADDPAGSAVTAVTQTVTIDPEDADGGRSMASIEQRLEAGRGDAERRARDELRDAMASARLEPEHLLDKAGAFVPIQVATLPKSLQERIDVALATLPSVDDVDTDLDVLKLTLTAEAALADIAAGKSGVYLLPVDFALSASRRRQERYLQICRKLSTSVRQRIVFMLAGVPAGASHSRLLNMIGRLTPFGRGIGLDLEDAELGGTDLAQLHIQLVAMPAERILAAARTARTKLGRQIAQMRSSNTRIIARQAYGIGEQSALVSLGVDLISIKPDVTRVKRSARRVADEAFRAAAFAAAIENSASGIVIGQAIKPDYPMVLANPAFCRLTGYTAEELIGRSCRMLQGPQTDRQVVAEIREALDRGHQITRELLNYRKDGTTFWNKLSISPVRDGAGVLTGFVALQVDVTELRRLEEHWRESTDTLEGLAEIVAGYGFRCVMSRDGRLEITQTRTTPALARFDFGAGEPGPSLPGVHPDDHEVIKAAVMKSAQERTPLRVEFRRVDRSGEEVWFRANARPIPGPDGSIVWQGIAVDVTAEKVALLESAAAGRDALTGVLDRNLFRSVITEHYALVRAEGCLLAVLAVDLAAFGTVNHAFGMEAGDAVLKIVATRLTEYPSVKAVGRTRGDRFGASLWPVRDRADAMAKARELARLIALPMEVGGRTITVLPCIGVALYPDHAGGIDRPDVEVRETLIKAVNVALGAAKRAGPGSCVLYSAEIDDRVRNRAILHQSLHEAFEKRQFSLHFQPVVELDSGRILGAEALIRWSHPKLGLQRPDQFIPLAEESGLIVPMGTWVMEEALRRLRGWDSDGLGGPRVAVNVAAAQLQDPDALRELRDRIIQSGVNPMQVELELTESALIDPTPAVLANLEALRDMGVTIAIDDFGTGYSSFRYLRALPLDKLKIDQSFVRRMALGSSDAAIVRGIIGIGRDLGLEVVVEGVETAEQRDIVLREGCRIGQGYLYSMPLDAEDFAWMYGSGVRLPLPSPGRDADVDQRRKSPLAPISETVP